jgi:hypothetical protein
MGGALAPKGGDLAISISAAVSTVHTNICVYSVGEGLIGGKQAMCWTNLVAPTCRQEYDIILYLMCELVRLITRESCRSNRRAPR